MFGPSCASASEFLYRCVLAFFSPNFSALNSVLFRNLMLLHKKKNETKASFPLLYFPYSTGRPSNTGSLFFLFFLSFMFNLLSCLFREASCGECVYLEDLILFSGRLALGFAGGTGCQLRCRLRRYGGAILWQSKCLFALWPFCLSPHALCLPPYPRLHCFTDYVTARFPTRPNLTI